MDFVIPAGSSANLPKEMVDKIVEEAIEKSYILKLINARDQFIEIANEGTIPVLGEEDLDKVYRIDTTDDITTLDEMDFAIKHPDLNPIELGTWIRLKRKQLKQYPELKLDTLFRNRISRAIGRSADLIALKGDTSAGGATNKLSVGDGIEKLSLAANCANTPVNYTSSNAQAVLDAVAEAVNDLGVYGEDEYLDDLVLFASPDFVSSAKKSADKNMVGYDIDSYAPLGLRKVVFIHGIPVLKRAQLSGEKAVLTNLKGAFAAYFGQIEVDVEHQAARRADLLVVTYSFDFQWALYDGSSKAQALIEISKSS